MKLKTIFLSLLLLCFSLIPVPVYAAGSGNVDGGGGSLNQGKEGYTWPGVGYDGIRLTVVDTMTGQPVSHPIDYTNVNVAALSSEIYHFGKVSKANYRGGAALSPQVGGYKYHNPEAALPQIISGSSRMADITSIRHYFCSEAAAMMVAGDTGISFENIESGAYKLMIEPVIYLMYQHIYLAITTTEAGLYNRLTGGDLGSHFPTVVMKNHALALFLEREDLGFQAWKGPTGSARTTEEMIRILGLGIISYNDQLPTEITYDQQYRVDTEVIVAVEITSYTQKTPSNSAYASFRINGKTYSHNNIYLPENGSQLAWVKWRTPKEPGMVTITITSNCQTSVGTIRAEIVDLNKNPPPDPKARDRRNGFSIPTKPHDTDTSSLTWGEWDCWWHEYWVWNSNGDDSGYYEDLGWWEYEWLSYAASLTGTMKIRPDEKSPTAAANAMKSGYGFTAEIAAQVHSSAPGSHLTGAQNVVMYFPEFNYQTYWRLLKRMNTGYSSTFEFQENEYSTYGSPVHFLPIWYPDGRYTAYARCQDAWTPAGMLQLHLTDDITIKDSLFDDWHIRRSR